MALVKITIRGLPRREEIIGGVGYLHDAALMQKSDKMEPDVPEWRRILRVSTAIVFLAFENSYARLYGQLSGGESVCHAGIFTHAIARTRLSSV